MICAIASRRDSSRARSARRDALPLTSHGKSLNPQSWDGPLAALQAAGFFRRNTGVNSCSLCGRAFSPKPSHARGALNLTCGFKFNLSPRFALVAQRTSSSTRDVRAEVSGNVAYFSSAAAAAREGAQAPNCISSSVRRSAPVSGFCCFLSRKSEAIARPVLRVQNCPGPRPAAASASERAEGADYLPTRASFCASPTALSRPSSVLFMRFRASGKSFLSSGILRNSLRANANC